jgi:hypothetical protein
MPARCEILIPEKGKRFAIDGPAAPARAMRDPSISLRYFGMRHVRITLI